MTTNTPIGLEGGKEFSFPQRSARESAFEFEGNDYAGREKWNMVEE